MAREEHDLDDTFDYSKGRHKEEYTRGPWDLSFWDDGASLGTYKRIANFPKSNRNYKDDAKRVKACLDACAGIPTEQLEKSNVAALIKSLSEITKDMDEDSDGTCETLWEEVADARAALAPFREK